MRYFGIPLGLVILTAALGSACSGDGEPPRSGTDATPTVVTVTATDYEFEAPDTLQEGWTTVRLVNDGDAFHAALLVRLEEGRTVDGFREAYAEALRNRGPWNSLGLLGGIVAPPPQGSTNATLYLGAGQTMKDAQTWLEDMRSAPPFSGALGGVVIEEAGGEAYFEADLTLGTHVLFCVITAPDGRRHWEHGMLLQFQAD